MNCIYCDAELPNIGSFCPNCFKQVKCKHCSENLLKDAKICVYCSEEVIQKTSNNNLNTIKFSETETERNFEASFTDTVGQSISDAFGMIIANKMISPKKNLQNTSLLSDNKQSTDDTIEIQAEILYENITIKEPGEKNTPTLKEIKLRDLAKNEADWLLVYAYHATEGGKKEFTRENIIQLYKETERKTEARMKNLSKNFKSISKSLYIKPTNDTAFILLENGISKASEIFSGNSNSKTSNNTKKKTKVKSDKNNTTFDLNKDLQAKPKKAKSTKTINFVDLNLDQESQKSLKDFFNSKKPKNQNEQVVVVMKWYKDNVNQNEISINEISYLMKICSKPPAALAQVIINIKAEEYRWVINTNNGNIQLTSIGENHVINNLPK